MNIRTSVSCNVINMIEVNLELTKIIPLTRGKVALVDSEDYEYLSRWSWSATARGYAFRGSRAGGKNERIYMHRQIMKVSDGWEVDHINGDRADNRKSNLRICEHRQNCYNRRAVINKYGHLGVSKNGKNGFMARITIGPKTFHLGTFGSVEEAAMARDKAAMRLHGKFARLNFPTEEATQCEQV